MFAAFSMSFSGAYLAICLCEQVRQCRIEGRIFANQWLLGNRSKQTSYLLLMAIVLGGVGIWAMHFVGMFAMEFHSPDEQELDCSFSRGLSFLSLIITILTSFLGLIIASNDPMFSKSKQEIIEDFFAEAKSMTLAEVRKINFSRVLRIICTQSLTRLVIGGFITGCGITCMHFLGLLGLVLPAKLNFHPGMVVASLVVCTVSVIVSFWIFFRLLSLFPEREALRLLATCIIAGAITNAHLLAMHAASFEYHPETDQRFEGNWFLHKSYSNTQSFYITMTASLYILLFCVVFLMASVRHVILEQSKLLRKADQILIKLAEVHNGASVVRLQLQAEEYVTKRRTSNENQKSSVHNSLFSCCSPAPIAPMDSVRTASSSSLQANHPVTAFANEDAFLHVLWLRLTQQHYCTFGGCLHWIFGNADSHSSVHDDNASRAGSGIISNDSLVGCDLVEGGAQGNTVIEDFAADSRDLYHPSSNCNTVKDDVPLYHQGSDATCDLESGRDNMIPASSKISNRLYLEEK